MKDKESRDELPDLLRDLKRRDDGFKVPADYFGSFEASVFQKIEARGDRPKTSLKPVRGGGMRVRTGLLKYVAAIAASIALALGAWWFLRPVPDVNPVAAELSAEDVEAYLLDNIRDFESDQLIVLCEEAVLPEISANPGVPQQRIKKPAEDISPEDVEELLKDMSDEELEQLL